MMPTLNLRGRNIFDLCRNIFKSPDLVGCIWLGLSMPNLLSENYLTETFLKWLVYN